MNTRNWSIRSKIVALVAVPISALLVLWIFATSLTVGPALSLLGAQALLDDVGVPGETLVAELQRERRLSVVYLSRTEEQTARRASDLEQLRSQWQATDAAVADFRRRATEGGPSDDRSVLRVRIEQTLAELEILATGRGFVQRREMDAAGALGLYNGVVDTAFQMFGALASLPDNEINRQARALTDIGQAREILGRADAVLAGAFAAGRLSDDDHRRLVQIIATHRFLLDRAVAELPEPDSATYHRMAAGEDFTALRQLQDVLINDRPGPDGDDPDAAPDGAAPDGDGAAPDGGATPTATVVDEARWSDSYESVQQQLREFELLAADALAERSMPTAIGILARLAAAGLVGLAAVIAAVVISLRVGRSLIHRLTGLRATALELAGDRLPAVVARLRRGEDVDVAAEAPPLEYGTDEIGQVGHAFSEVQRTAVRSAVEEAALRRGLNETFLNIARRSQTLLHRQLALLDRMERRSTDPEELEDLFRVDHMATRMRRHAEDLVILAGATPGRGWRNPVPMIDVIRGAVSEVEEYARVHVTTVEPAAVVGRAVGDVIHLLAELIENATSFSPPQTLVTVVGQNLPNGYAVEVEDRGLGMTPDAVTEANQRLAQPPDFDPHNSARLGLFVVAQLAAKHGVGVRLRPSPFGGITAVALIPAELVVPESEVLALPSGRPPTALTTVRPGPDGADQPASTATLGALLSALPDSPTRSDLPAMPDSPAVSDPSTSSGSPAAPAPSPTVPAVPGVPTVQPDLPPRRRPVSLPTRRSEGAQSTTEDGLPRRVRQSSLAPQLRQAPDADGQPQREAPQRSPGEVRALMSALQAGTARGRRAAGLVADTDVTGSVAGDPSPTVTAGPARGTATPPPGAVLQPPSAVADTSEREL
ncbi:nitrate- and nitrite sensing domain-containing protein [Solwaraspora sp. WMMD791]|uniref:sensor histidine kinase n=1 Tax=Solwaraspora sp. WMMD791 TaxID=3016086 RepID=UPI00249A3B8B|nr:nitrate- and nitrite sensing domain-containing protein [Solwaraspora sp. WMMD791]WFE27121.1 nitrate- and nitrite sensing domain-containing protein [Solwaraspora sp. WMMD791]